MSSLIERHGFYSLQVSLGGGRYRRLALHTRSKQMALEQQRQFDSAAARGVDSPLPSRTPIAQVVGAYVRHIRGFTTAKSVQTDIYYLCEAFGPICPELQDTSRRPQRAATAEVRPRCKDGMLKQRHSQYGAVPWLLELESTICAPITRPSLSGIEKASGPPYAISGEARSQCR
jgi:hypothetical protein